MLNKKSQFDFWEMQSTWLISMMHLINFTVPLGIIINKCLPIFSPLELKSNDANSIQKSNYFSLNMPAISC